MNYLDLEKAKQAFIQGKNITKFLRDEFGEGNNTAEIIEIAYDLQAGSYIEQTNLNRNVAERHTSQVAEILDTQLSNQSSILDVGTGELTSLGLVLNKIKSPLSQVYAFDISWSRIHKGKTFLADNLHVDNISIIPFVADAKKIPLCSKCIDVVTSDHALEPNGNDLSALLKEIFRVSRHRCVLFEPSYELNSKKGKHRMDKLGYIKNMEGEVNALGGKILDIKPLNNTDNPLNPTACYIIEPPETQGHGKHSEPKLSVPGTDYWLVKDDQFYASPDTGLLFPILRDIPVLKCQHGILATSIFE